MDVRKGQAPAKLTRSQFHERFMNDFLDPAYQAEAPGLARIEEIAWKAYEDGRKAPLTRKAGPGFEDPDYDLSVQWLETRDRLIAAHQRWSDTASPARVLVECGASRNDCTCPGEMSKSFRLAQLAREVLTTHAVETDLLDLSHLVSVYYQHNHPSKGC